MPRTRRLPGTLPALISFLALLTACLSPEASVRVIILDGKQAHTLTSASRVPADWLKEAGLTLHNSDHLLYQGQPVAPDEALPPADSYTLHIRRAVNVTLVTPTSQRLLQTGALTVGEALIEAGIPLQEGDFLFPPPDTPIENGMTIIHQPGRDLTVLVDGREVPIRSAAHTVGQALAEAGMPLTALDYSLPAEDEPLPADGRIRVLRVREVVTLTQTSIPYESRFEASAELELDQTALLQAGEVGLAVGRTRVRLEDDMKHTRQVEEEAVVRPPQDRVVGYGTKITIRAAVIDGITIEYWRVLRMYATSYSPCRSGTPGVCYYYTSSGKPVQKGVVAMKRAWYYAFRGQPLYIPGYGRATVEDVGAGFPDGRYWIDLGWSEEEYQPMTGWVTVYFLTPVPPNPVYLLP